MPGISVGVRNQTQALLALEPKLCPSALLLHNPPSFGSVPWSPLFAWVPSGLAFPVSDSGSPLGTLLVTVLFPHGASVGTSLSVANAVATGMSIRE